MSAPGAGRAPRLREAGAFDLELLAGLHRAAFDAQADAEIWDAEALAELLAMPGALALIAEAGEAPLGFVLGRVAAEEAELLTLGVRPAARGLGVGRALVDAMVFRSAALGARKVFLEVAEDNTAARTLYLSAGFREVGRRPGYYRRANRTLDAVTMQLTPR
ncbi:MAG: GNAT family N-acetyltransferase [Kiloniellales bacterium]|nr:GNAT family N-acetyltransferase [Kiloniellales bacterium]